MAQTDQSDPVQEFIALPRDQQMSTLQQLPPDKQDKLLAKVKEYRSRKPSTTAVQPSDWRDALTRIDPHQPIHSASDLGREVERGVGNIGAGALGVVLRPVATAEGVGKFLAHPVNGAESMSEQFFNPDGSLNPHALENLEGFAGQAAVLGTAGEATGPVTRGLIERAAKTREGIQTATQKLVGTGPRVARNLVEDVKTGNSAADSYSALQARIETAREVALKEGNKKYSAVNESLNHLPADNETIQNAVVDATAKIKGSETEPTILKDISGKISRGESLTYEDEQGYYSELGTAISKGNLPGDVYTALDTLHEAIGDDMQRIANSQGMGEELTSARNYWRRMKQAFGNKPYNATDAASSVLRSASPEMTEQAAVANRVRLLSSFDPEIQTDYAKLLKAGEKAKGKPSATPGETSKINAEDIQAAKKEQPIVAKAPHHIRRVGYSLGVIWPAIDVIRTAVRGEMPSFGGVVGSGVGIAGGAHVVAGLLERPDVVEFFTKATPKDLEQIPPDLRADMPQIVRRAQAQGIEVSPALTALVGAIGAPRGPKAQAIQRIADQHRAGQGEDIPIIRTGAVSGP